MLPTKEQIRLELMRRSLWTPGSKYALVAPKMTQLFADRNKIYRIGYGGRSAGRSTGFANALLILGAVQPLRILCAREYQTSISQSIHQLLENRAEILGLSDYYRFTKHTAEGTNGTEFIFRGLKTDPHKLKSLEDIDYVYIEEAEKVSNDSFQKLDATIRKDPAPTISGKAEIWAAFNPDLEDDFFYKHFVTNTPASAAIVRMSFRDNPWLPPVMKQKAEAMAATDYDSYMHVYEGECRHNSDAQILKGKVTIEDFVAQKHWDGPYYGADWGFSQDPTVLIKAWVDSKANTLYIDEEAWAIGCETEHLPKLFSSVGGSDKHVIRADSARPETISHMKRHGYPKIVGVEKWKGSVEDGVTHLRSYVKIVIRPSCPHTIEESKKYSFKIDRLTGDVLTDIEDKWNHCMDGIRYALSPLIKQNGAGEYLKWINQEVAKLQEVEVKQKFEEAKNHKVNYIELLAQK